MSIHRHTKTKPGGPAKIKGIDMNAQLTTTTDRKHFAGLYGTSLLALQMIARKEGVDLPAKATATEARKLIAQSRADAELWSEVEDLPGQIVVVVSTTHPAEDCADCTRAANSAKDWILKSDRQTWTHQISPLDQPVHTARVTRR